MKCLMSSCICYIPKACLRLGIHALRAFRLISIEQKQELLSGLQNRQGEEGEGEDSHDTNDNPDNHNPKTCSKNTSALSVVD